MFTIIGGDGREYGPVTVEQIRAWMAAGRANLDTQARLEGSDEWHRLGDYPEFSGPVAPPPLMTATAAPATGELAGRLERLGAWAIDLVLSIIVALPGLMMLGVSVIRQAVASGGQLPPDVLTHAMGGAVVLTIGGLALIVVQTVLLSTRGQTVGKIVAGIHIVTVTDGSNPGFVRAALLRSFVPWLIQVLLNFVLLAGYVFFIVDSCFIFREDRRCIHDLIAGTRVVKGQGPAK